MRPPKNYQTSLRDSVRWWIDKVRQADILIGVPCYNSEETIRHVVAVAAEGLDAHFSGLKSAILISDGGSLDDTREEAYNASVPEGVERRVFIYRGLPGKGTSLRAVFEVAGLLQAKACAVFDSDLRSITPEWIRCMIEPVLDGRAEFLAPRYKRHKYDGTITNHFVYPLTRALYGQRVRQPIGGDFGFSRRLADFYAAQDVWLSDVAYFGIDVWMTTLAINEGFDVRQVDLGAKLHSPKDPSADLGPMFCQVISTLFYLMGRYEGRWRRVRPSRPVETVAHVLNGSLPDPLSVDVRKMVDEFIEGFDQFDPLYKRILNAENYGNLKKCAQAAHHKGDCNIPAGLWARIVFDFAYTYRNWHRNRRRLVDLLVPLYFGRTASFCQEVQNMDYEEAEAVIEGQAEVFEGLMPYLVRRLELGTGADDASLGADA